MISLACILVLSSACFRIFWACWCAVAIFSCAVWSALRSTSAVISSARAFAFSSAILRMIWACSSAVNAFSLASSKIRSASCLAGSCISRALSSASLIVFWACSSALCLASATILFASVSALSLASAMMAVAVLFAFSTISILMITACFSASTMVFSANFSRESKGSSFSLSIPAEGLFAGLASDCGCSSFCVKLLNWSVKLATSDCSCSNLWAKLLSRSPKLLTRESKCSSFSARPLSCPVKLLTKADTSASSRPLLTILNFRPQSSFSMVFTSICGLSAMCPLFNSAEVRIALQWDFRTWLCRTLVVFRVLVERRQVIEHPRYN